jgi:cell division protein FtsQ
MARKRKMAARRKRKKAVRRLPLVPWRQIGLATLAAITIAVGSVALVYVLDRPLKRLSIEGDFNRVSAANLGTAIRPQLNGGFVSVDLDAIRAVVAAMPWVSDVNVRRRWPDGIHVRVTEHTAIARWGERHLINDDGEIFVQIEPESFAELPILNGPDGSAGRVAVRLKALGEDLGGVNLRLAAVRLDPRGAWSIRLRNGPEVRFGRRDVDGRIQRFLQLASGPLADRFGHIRYIDMRYSNGFAVGWRDEPAPNEEGEGNSANV